MLTDKVLDGAARVLAVERGVSAVTAVAATFVCGVMAGLALKLISPMLAAPPERHRGFLWFEENPPELRLNGGPYAAFVRPFVIPHYEEHAFRPDVENIRVKLGARGLPTLTTDKEGRVHLSVERWRGRGCDDANLGP